MPAGVYFDCVNWVGRLSQGGRCYCLIGILEHISKEVGMKSSSIDHTLVLTDCGYDGTRWLKLLLPSPSCHDGLYPRKQWAKINGFSLKFLLSWNFIQATGKATVQIVFIFKNTEKSYQIILLHFFICRLLYAYVVAHMKARGQLAEVSLLVFEHFCLKTLLVNYLRAWFPQSLLTRMTSVLMVWFNSTEGHKGLYMADVKDSMPLLFTSSNKCK